MLSLTILIGCTVFWKEFLIRRAATIPSIKEETLLTNLRQMEVPLELQQKLRQEETEDITYELLLFSYLAIPEEDTEAIVGNAALLTQREEDLCTKYTEILDAIYGDLACFPVPESSSHPEYSVSYENSWMQGRTYGGDRGHEGCDIMASVNTRGIYPILSMTDGVIEKIGWLPQGGYRIGIRSDSGGYFYYAHLAEYAKEFAQGEKITAGQFLGFMGDTGYSEVEGTVGNFDVHLHVGIYYNDPVSGEETSVNPYWILKSLEEEKQRYDF